MVSIIIPVYNVAKYLSRCLESVLNQNYTNLQILVIDDGSSDGSEEICDEYRKRDTRIEVIHKQNGGLSNARNCGINHAKGKYIFFLDGDDFINIHTIELLCNIMENNDFDFVACKHKRVFELQEVNQEINTKFVLTRYSKTQAMQNINDVKVTAWNKLYRSKLFKDFRFKESVLHEDEYSIHHILYNCSKVAVINTELYYYTEREGSITAQLMKNNLVDKTEALLERVQFSIENDWVEVYEENVNRFLNHIYEMCSSCNEKIETYDIKKYINKNYKNVVWIAFRYKIHIKFKYRFIWIIYYFYLCKRKVTKV